MNSLDKQYTALLQDILDNGHAKSDRTGTGTISVFGRQIRHKMSEGFPLLTTKKMYFKGVITELLWFLRGDSDIRFLWENNCTIWDGDWYKQYQTTCSEPYTLEEIKQKIKSDYHSFHESMFDMGPVYGKQWRSWDGNGSPLTKDYEGNVSSYLVKPIDQIANLIHDLKTNPDSRRLMVNAWNVGELDSMVLPPCHYSWQVYTRELSNEERCKLAVNEGWMDKSVLDDIDGVNHIQTTWTLNANNIPTRAISLMWNQRSVDTFLGLPFNIASYGLLLEIIAKAVNMVPDELIGNLGDTHLYSNHVEQAKEQIGRALSIEERIDLASKKYDNFDIMDFGIPFTCTHEDIDKFYPVERRTREPYSLPTLNINTEFWPTESGECGVGPLHSNIDFIIKNIQIDDFEVIGYQSHPAIKAPLSN